ncbi:MAG: cupin [Gammaproteobacteria bacterium]|nr:cupin [Gammaproteobacteria bacterium]
MLDTNLRQIIDTASGRFKPYDRYGDPIAGMSWIPLSGELANGVFECFLLRIDAGAQSKPHEHTGHEEFLVLEGELVDCDGQSFCSGDYVHFLPGSKHSSHTPEGCTMLVILRGNNRSLRADELE